MLAAVVGVALGVAIAWSPLLANALVPFLVFVNTLPKVAIAPLFLIWMGYGIFPNMLMGALIGFFPVVINTAVGLSQVEADMLDLGRVFNAPKWKIFVKIRIPNALPYILSALKITATAAVVGAIVGEFVASQKGLGYVIVTTQSSMNTSVAFAALIWISVVGLAALRRRRRCWRVCGRRGPRASTDDRREGEPHDSHICHSRSPRCSRAAGSASAQEKFTFALNWFAVGDHAAYWVALEKGYYKAKGLDVTLENSKGSGDSIAKVDTGRADAGLADAAVVIAVQRARHHGEDGRHGVRQDPAQLLQPQEQPARQAQGPRRQDARRASGRQPAPDVPGLRQGERHRRQQGHVGQHRARRQDRRASPRSAWTASATTPPACRSMRRPPARATW